MPAPLRKPLSARAGLAALALLATAGGAPAAPAALPGHPGLPLLPATEPAFHGPPQAVIAWPCLDRPGCDGDRGAPSAVSAAGAAQPASATVAEAEMTAIPLPAALTLLGLGLSALGVMMHRARSRG